MKNEGQKRRMEQGPELPPPSGRPETMREFLDLVHYHPEHVSLYYSDDDIRAFVPNPNLAEQIIEAAHRHESQEAS